MAVTAIDIGEFSLDIGRGLVSRHGDVVPVRAKTFAFLCHLAGNRGRVVSKDELMAAVWPGLFVSEDSLTQCVSELRKALGDSVPIRTVPKRGYLLDVPAEALPAGTPGPAFPAIAVLPFRNRGMDTADDLLIDGIVEEITYGLARFRSMVVIARNSAFTFPVVDRPPLREIGARLGANFIAEGSATRQGGRLLVAVALSHASSGRHIWGGQFDFAETELLTMSIEIATTIISRLVNNIDHDFLRGSLQAPSPFAAFENFVRGVAFLRSYGPGVNERARMHFERAIEIDPDCAVAHAYLALADVIIADYGAAPRAVLEAARDRVSHAIAIEPEEARCHRIMSLVRLYLREHEAAERFLRRAYDLNPYDADGLVQLGFVIAMRGRPAEGLVWIEKAIALNPFRPYWYDFDLVHALYMLGRYDEAAAIMSASPNPSPVDYLWLAASHAMAGAFPQACAALARFRETFGDADMLEQARQWSEFEHSRDLDHFRDGLRLAATVLAESDI